MVCLADLLVSFKVVIFCSRKNAKAAIANLLSVKLQKEGYRCACAFDGEQGVDIFDSGNFEQLHVDDEFVTTLLSQISWSNHLAIISKAKTLEERHFYITLCAKENYSARELSRQIDRGYYERYMLSREKLLLEPIKGLKENPFLNSYVKEFLNLPSNFKEADLRKGLI